MNLSATLVITVIALYFGMLIALSYFTSRKATNDSFFLGERNSAWYLVSFGMIGASLSGITFLSIPGWVGNAANQFSYMQAVLGYFFGYLVIAYVLIPLYYKMNLTSIYEYLKSRFGFWSYKTGAAFFLLSRIVGSAVRLMLVAGVLQESVFKGWISFEFTVIISVALIWVYTNRGGIKTIVWTDTIQTAFMLLSLVLTIWFLANELDLVQTKGLFTAVSDSNYSQVFFFDDFMSKNHFLKHFLGGMFITIGMTGLDQDMMQKNLSCRSIKDAQKNIISMAALLVVVNLIFLGLGALLYMYAEQFGIDFKEKGDWLFAKIAMDESAGPLIGIVFLLGLIAATYSTADSALTALTTSFSVDFLNVNDRQIDDKKKMRMRKLVHIGMSAVIILTVIFLYYAIGKNDSAIGALMTLAGFTYGPLIGMFFFGILTKRSINDRLIPVMSILSIIVTVFLWYYSKGAPGVAKGSPGIFGEYQFGFELIILNALITFGLLFMVSRKSTNDRFSSVAETLIDWNEN